MSLTAIYKYPNNGYSPAKELEVGKEYRVSNLHMGSSYTNIWLEGFPFSFNSVQLDFYKDGKPFDIYRSPEYNPYLRRNRRVANEN